LFSRSGKTVREKADRLRSQLALPERYFLYVGRLVRPKGVLDLLEAYASLPVELRSQVSVVLAGNGPMRPELESLAREIYPGEVQFAGFVHRDDLPNYYSLAECLVLPTHSDTWGMVVNEALASGLPVICSDVAGCAADLVQSNGRLVACGDVRQLANAMQEISSDEALRGRMSQASEILGQSYSPEICAAGLADATLSMEAYVG
jgi:glycosyltransferase involved in cell wall biosynthesis